MVKLKGQFMLISAIMVSFLLMSTATTMSEIQRNDFSPMDHQYHVNTMDNLGEKLDLASKAQRQEFQQAIGGISDYSFDTNFWRERRCYNVTMSNPDTDFKMNCIGNGSIFHDTFQDGEYRDPTWAQNTEDGNLEVTREYAPGNRFTALMMEENTTDSVLEAAWRRDTDIWDERWAAKGLFYTEEIDSSVYQSHKALLYHNDASPPGISVSLGVQDSSGNDIPFEINGELINNVQETETISLDENTWYHWEISHDSSGTYTGRLWEQGESRPTTAQAVSIGQDNPSELRHGAFRINGTQNRPYIIEHAFFKLQNQ